jgi:hypothetical protein
VADPRGWSCCCASPWANRVCCSTPSPVALALAAPGLSPSPSIPGCVLRCAAWALLGNSTIQSGACQDCQLLSGEVDMGLILVPVVHSCLSPARSANW